jgi:hypothetical protein
MEPDSHSESAYDATRQHVADRSAQETWWAGWHKVGDFRRLFPEYKDLSDDTVSTKMYEKADIPLNPAHPWQTLDIVLLIALGIPALVLLLGAAVGWALSGFVTRAT